jgi:hypothetical protein
MEKLTKEKICSDVQDMDEDLNGPIDLSQDLGANSADHGEAFPELDHFLLYSFDRLKFVSSAQSFFEPI